ncbi:uncharacterized protein LOC143187237 [Calliopsis andreniformis]|uniref:uncharacterized protein LOC143187237 n=1 Tax=Calliopsis andreniformis TaxID=337506 RepID=UPI003FCD34DB
MIEHVTVANSAEATLLEDLSLRTLYLFCYFCTVCTLAVSFENAEESEVSEWRLSNSSESGESQEASDFANTNATRDKRALGLILSGLAQVFGYTVSPVQLASLPNATPAPSAGTNQPSPSPSPMNSTQSNSSTPATPRQRETIRFTGVVNFGNSSGLLNHLQQYERIFHGNGSNGGSGSNGTSGSTATPPTQMTPDPRVVTLGQGSPFLVNFPIPSMRQPPLPEIPAENISLSYPRPLIPIRNTQEMVFRKNESMETLTVENKEIQDGRDVQSPPPPPPPSPSTPYTPFYNLYADEPRWKKEHEERLAELERKQQEHAERLRQQEFKNRVRDDFGSQEVRKDHGEEDSGERDSPVRVPLSQDVKAPEESEEDDKYEDYENKKNNFKQYDDSPQTDDNYANVKYDEPLPISEDDEQRKPEDLRNSYGEPLNSRELNDDRFSYFGKFKDSQDDFREPESPNFREDSKDDKDWDHANDDSDEMRKEEDLPASNKYEEYNLEEGTDSERKDPQNYEEDASDPFSKYPNKAPFTNENESHFREQKSSEEVDFSSYMPLIVPFRYLDAPDELKKTGARSSVTEKSEKIDNLANKEGSKKVSSKELRVRKKETIKSKMNISERPMPKKIQEGEQKERIWPPPFDFVLDSTIQTGVTTKPGYSKSSNTPLEFKINIKDEHKTPQQSGERELSESPAQRHQDILNAYYQRPRGNLKPETAPRHATPGPSKSIETEDTRSQSQQRRNIPEIWKSYKYYNLNGEYKNGEPKIIEGGRAIQGSNPSKRFESLKRSTEKIEPTMGNYYRGGYPEEEMGKSNFQIPAQTAMLPIGFYDPMGAGGYLNFGDRMVQSGKKAIDLTMPRRDTSRYDESLTKLVSEPESTSEKVGNFAISAIAMIMLDKKRLKRVDQLVISISPIYLKFLNCLYNDTILIDIIYLIKSIEAIPHRHFKISCCCVENLVDYFIHIDKKYNIQ